MMRSWLFAPLLLVACGGSTSPVNGPVGPAASPPPATASASGTVAEPASVTQPTAAALPTSAGNRTQPDAPKVVGHVDVPPAIAAIVAAPDRSDDDKKLDAGRHPGELLAFFGVTPGMHVGEIVAGGGYTTELLARAVAPNGVVYGENPKFILEKYAEKPWNLRLAKPVNKSIVRANREPNDPFPPEAHDLDLVVDVLFYHDTVWLGTDRDAMNAAVFKALKHGGVYGVIDHSAKDGAGVTEVKTLHRIEERAVRDEIQRAGFRLESVATFLANPNDARDWNASPMVAAAKRGTSDRFVLKFVKP